LDFAQKRISSSRIEREKWPKTTRGGDQHKKGGEGRADGHPRFGKGGKGP